jgi:hypothetical protein
MDETELCNSLLKSPETYRTLLGEKYGRNTETIILRKKILRNVKKGIIGRTFLNGSRGRESLIFNLDKEYLIVIINKDRTYRYFYCQEIDKINDNDIRLVECSELLNDKWKNNKESMIVKTWNVIKCI